jgi:hypothetical protein
MIVDIAASDRLDDLLLAKLKEDSARQRKRPTPENPAAAQPEDLPAVAVELKRKQPQG